MSGNSNAWSKCERPVTRYQPPDWHARNAKLAHHAYSTRNDSHTLRKEAQLLKIETDTKTKWHNYENNMRLSERYIVFKKKKFFEKGVAIYFLSIINGHL